MDASDLLEAVKQFDQLVRCELCLKKKDYYTYRKGRCEHRGRRLCSGCWNHFHSSNYPRSCNNSTCAFNSTFDQLVKLFPKMCLYSSNGCPIISFLERHEPFCGFRPIKCHIGENYTCTWNGTVKDWQDHVNSTHSTFSLSFVNSTFKLLLTEFNSSWTNRCFRIVNDNKLFLLYVCKHEGQLYQAVCKISLEKPTCDYFFSITFKDKTDAIFNKYTIKSDEYDVNSFPKKSLYVASVPIEDLNDLVKQTGDLDVTYHVTRKDHTTEAKE